MSPPQKENSPGRESSKININVALILAKALSFVKHFMYEAKTLTPTQEQRYKRILWHTFCALSMLVCVTCMGIALIIHGF
jgi:hypothetical protein